MAPKARDVLEKLVADNPGASESELFDAFIKVLKSDPALQKAIAKELFDELEADGFITVLRPKRKKH